MFTHINSAGIPTGMRGMQISPVSIANTSFRKRKLKMIGTKILRVKVGNRIRQIPQYKWFIDRSTEVGEDADYYEIKPYGGKKLIDRRKICRKE
jgi:hypothetical protein